MNSDRRTESTRLEERHQPRRRDEPVGVFEEFSNLLPVHGAVQPDADPAAVADVRLGEVTLRGRCEGLLSTRFRGGPEMGELTIVMPVRPEHRELLPDEVPRRAVRGL